MQAAFHNPLSFLWEIQRSSAATRCPERIDGMIATDTILIRIYLQHVLSPTGHLLKPPVLPPNSVCRRSVEQQPPQRVEERRHSLPIR